MLLGLDPEEVGRTWEADRLLAEVASASTGLEGGESVIKGLCSSCLEHTCQDPGKVPAAGESNSKDAE